MLTKEKSVLTQGQVPRLIVSSQGLKVCEICSHQLQQHRPGLHEHRVDEGRPVRDEGDVCRGPQSNLVGHRHIGEPVHNLDCDDIVKEYKKEHSKKADMKPKGSA